MNKLIHFCLHQKLVVLILLAFVIGWGIRVAPFDWDTGNYPRDPVAVDAIPDLGDNQQIAKLVRLERVLEDIGTKRVSLIDVSTAEVTVL